VGGHDRGFASTGFCGGVRGRGWAGGNIALVGWGIIARHGY